MTRSPLHKRNNSEINAMLAASERAGTCLAATTERTNDLLLRRMRSSDLVSPFPKLYAHAAIWKNLTKTQRARHVLLGVHALHPEWAFYGVSAAVLWGLQVPYAELDGAVHVLVRHHAHELNNKLVKRHIATRPELVDTGGVPLTSPARTAFDCMRAMGLRHGLAIADSTLRLFSNDLHGSGCRRPAAGVAAPPAAKMGVPPVAGSLAPSVAGVAALPSCAPDTCVPGARVPSADAQNALADYVSRMRGFRGVAQARATAALADPRSANGGESVARAAMCELGYAIPDLQVPFRDPIEPWKIYYADYVWRIGPAKRDALTAPGGRARAAGTSGYAAGMTDVAAGMTDVAAGATGPATGEVIGELDGYQKYFDPAMTGTDGFAGAILRERRRESRLTLTGSPILRFTYDDVLNTAVFNHLLETYGVPRVRKPTIAVPPYVPHDGFDYLPPEAYQ